jgi:hypothetical protein
VKKSITLALGIVGALACADAGEPAPNDLATVADSAGVVLVELPATLAALAAPDLPGERMYRIGTDSSNLELFRVASARFMADGRLVIADGGSLDFALVGPAGRVETRFGHRGQGPGEFLSISSVHATAAGTILVFDDLLGRLTEFDAAGQVLDTRRRIEPDAGSDVVPLIASVSGPLVGVYADNRVFPKGVTVFRDTTPLLRYPARAMRPDTLALWPTKVWSLSDVGIGGLRVEVAFAPDLLSFGQADRFALADTHEPRVSVRDEQGNPTMEVRWREVAAPVTEAELERFRAERDDQLPDNLPDAVRSGYVQVPSHDTRPVLNGVALDRDGGLWIAPASLSTSAIQTWLAVDRRGSVLGKVRLPASSRILDVREGWIAAWDRDEYDRETVTVYRVVELS